tara:strand:+ start:787 stop:990 length:204 start_codon:yes stop_codon:yes gene_type:complete
MTEEQRKKIKQLSDSLSEQSKENNRLHLELAQAKEDAEFWKMLFDRAQKTSESLLETNRALIARRYS